MRKRERGEIEFRELMKAREDRRVGSGRGLCQMEWRQDYGDNIRLSINVTALVASISQNWL